MIHEERAVVTPSPETHPDTSRTISYTKRTNVIRAEIRNLERLGPLPTDDDDYPGIDRELLDFELLLAAIDPLSQWRKRECWPLCSRRTGARVTAWRGPWFTSSALLASMNTRKLSLISVPKSGAGTSNNGRGMRNPNINGRTLLTGNSGSAVRIDTMKHDLPQPGRVRLNMELYCPRL